MMRNILFFFLLIGGGLFLLNPSWYGKAVAALSSETAPVVKLQPELSLASEIQTNLDAESELLTVKDDSTPRILDVDAGTTMLTQKVLSGTSFEPKSMDELLNTARHGDLDAQSEVQFTFFNGHAVPNTQEELLDWYRAMNKAGFSDAELRMGDAYINGIGIKQDFRQALVWYQKSAEMGNAYAQQSIGEMYYQAQGVTQDIQLAYMWLSIAAESELPEALDRRNQLEAEMTATQIMEAQKMKQMQLENNPLSLTQGFESSDEK